MTAIAPIALDHVALWVADRDAIAALLCRHLGMHEIERTDSFTLVGADARRGKLTLFAAEGPREPGVLERVVLRVNDLDAALAALPDGLAVRRSGEVAEFAGPEGLGLGLVGAETDLDYDLDHVVLRVPDPGATATALDEFGFERRDGRVAVADKHLRLQQGGAAEGERPLLNHLAVLVDSARSVEEAARARGIEIDDIKDAPNTLAVFLRGPDRIRIEYVEHKPTFSLV
ncbi:MAG TPA: VOC family protein [Conexibacter sp.]|jgi:catechol 2,3-dioxygenase-like lactoylglutathione lyase family enzyme